jgi:GT2 family glycosyltransferase
VSSPAVAPSLAPTAFAEAAAPLALVPPPEPLISVVVVAYDSGGALLRCLAAVDQPDEGVHEVIVVNNGAAGEEIDIVAASPRVRVLEPGRNLGFAAGCNLGAENATGDVLVFLNPDTIAASGALRSLARTLEDDSIAIAMARLRLLYEPTLLNSSGTVVHISGLGWAGGFAECASTVGAAADVAAPSGAAMAIRAETFELLGGFRPEFFMYHEDQELGWRARMAGKRVVIDPCADVYHDYEFDRHERKRYFLERNRLAFVSLSFSLRTLFVLAPVLVATELGMVALAAKQGWLRDKLGGSLWCARNVRALWRRRRETQALREVSDGELVRMLTPVLAPAAMRLPGIVRLVNPLLAAYWRLALRLI